jgi:hypothetical protein
MFKVFRQNAVALVSLMIALASLGYTAWRQERSERHRNLRAAAFEVLKSLGELQTLVLYAHYDQSQGMGNPITGWGRVLMIQDLCMLLPPQARSTSETLVHVWQANWDHMKDDEPSAKRILTAVQEERTEVLKVLEMFEVIIGPEARKTDAALKRWIDLCAKFNATIR